mmetsp:Transcript_136225/g.240140  ORF Transcript_136225/g.240140 Transcript_136225/m.240140 type:complete len:689 (-) Transcript_136225:42-2108(-)
MAVDLEGFERAYRLRSSADDDLLRLIFGETELEGLTKSNSSLVETARGYFPLLTSSTYDRLVREPDTLRLDKGRCEREMEQLAVQNYSAFISNAKVTQAVRQEFAGIQQLLDNMVDMLGPVQDGIQEFQATSSSLGSRRAALRNVLQQHASGSLLELLELPQLLDAAIRNQMYDESLELLSYCGTVSQGHEARGEEIPVLTNLHEQVAVQRANLHNSLVAQLKMDIHLPACVRVIGYLRRLQQHSEDELRLLFIEHRGSFLESHKQQVEVLRGSRGSVVTALKNAADLLRTHVFDIGMQYKALFGQEDGPLSAWLSEQIMWLTGLLQVHILPPPSTGARGAGQREAHREQMRPGAGKAGTSASSAGPRGPVMGARIDPPALATVLRQCLHASSTLKRLGGHFFPAVAGMFEARMEHHILEMLNVALLTFHAELGRYDWVASTALTGSGTGAGAATPEDSPGGGAGLQWLHPQALELTRHRPLAVFANDLIQMFNDLRQCTLYGLRAPVVSHCTECMQGAVNVLRSVRGSTPFHHGSPKAAEFLRLCEHFARILAPLVAAHLEALFGTGARVDVSSIVASMVPDLLPQTEVELSLPEDSSQWESAALGASEAAAPAASQAPPAEEAAAAEQATPAAAAEAPVAEAPAAAASEDPAPASTEATAEVTEPMQPASIETPAAVSSEPPAPGA